MASLAFLKVLCYITDIAMNRNNRIPIELELKKLDLNEREIMIYLICLELKQVSVQNIARKTGLSRPTVYRILESLHAKGLIIKIKQNKNSLIVAQSPDEILGILRIKKREIEEQEREFLRIISLLKNKYYFDGRNEIRTFSGKEGLHFLLENFSTTHSRKINVIFFGSNSPESFKIGNAYKTILRRLGKIEIKELYEKSFDPPKDDFVERKKLPMPLEDLSGIIIISDKFIHIKKDGGLMIENEEMVDMMRLFFGIIWKLTK